MREHSMRIHATLLPTRHKSLELRRLLIFIIYISLRKEKTIGEMPSNSIFNHGTKEIFVVTQSRTKNIVLTHTLC